MFRKVFGGAMVLSISGAIIVGGVFAWGATATSNGTAHVGKASTHSVYEAKPKALIGPNDGQFREVGHLELYNDAGSQYGLRMRNDGTVVVTDTNEDHAPDDGKCLLKDFQGQVTVGDTISIVLPGALQPGLGQVAIAVLPSAAPSCQDKTISFTATINGDLVALN